MKADKTDEAVVAPPADYFGGVPYGCEYYSLEGACCMEWEAVPFGVVVDVDALADVDALSAAVDSLAGDWDAATTWPSFSVGSLLLVGMTAAIGCCWA